MLNIGPRGLVVPEGVPMGLELFYQACLVPIIVSRSSDVIKELVDDAFAQAIYPTIVILLVAEKRSAFEDIVASIHLTSLAAASRPREASIIEGRLLRVMDSSHLVRSAHVHHTTRTEAGRVSLKVYGDSEVTIIPS